MGLSKRHMMEYEEKLLLKEEAAETMFAALKEVTEAWYEGDEDDLCVAMRKAIRAIDKAEGK